MTDKSIGKRGSAVAARRDARSAPRSAPKGDGGMPAFLVELAKNAPAMMWAFTATTFLSALLLFAIQPMFAKTVLPVLGGSPSVWSVSVFFFQTALLVGYLYAHLLINKAPQHLTGLIHVGVSVLAFSCLPIGMASWVGPPPEGDPYLWQLGLFTASVGLPFVAVSANAPLLQAWFARSGHPDARDPYFMYAASNLGSLIALIGYPFLLEPAFGLSELTHLWAYAYALLVLAIGGSFFLMRAAQARGVPETAAVPAREAATAVAPTLPDRLSWIGLAFVPSALVTAFTVHITTDVASAPLLWVMPLAIYLLTFVLVFRDRPLISREALLFLHLVALAVALIGLAQYTNNWMIVSLTGFAVFVTTALLAHRTLYEARPAPQFLTEFYLWMSFGGALGGMFTALVAPQIFSEVFEYPLLIALSMACRPGALTLPRERLKVESVPVAVVALIGIAVVVLIGIAASVWLPPLGIGDDVWRPLVRQQGPTIITICVLALAILVCVPRERLRAESVPFAIVALIGVAAIVVLPRLGDLWLPLMRQHGQTIVTFAVVCVLTLVMLASVRSAPRQLLAAGLICLALVTLPSEVKRGQAERSFFGVYRMNLTPNAEGSLFRTLVHGTTLHGAQRVAQRVPDGRFMKVDDTVPTTYYYPGSPIGQTVAKRREILAAKGLKGSFGVVGLGTGSSSCHKQEGERWKFFEIDPTVIRIAKDPQNFTFISKCQPNIDIAIGDARLTMVKEPDSSFDHLVIDAFTSDAIPVHMLTKEAIELFLSKLTPEGVVLLHTSNRHLDLNSVLAAIQKQLPQGSTGLVMQDLAVNRRSHPSQTGSVVVLFAKSEAALQPYRGLNGVTELQDNGLRAWTDDYSDILGAFISRWKGKG